MWAHIKITLTSMIVDGIYLEKGELLVIEPIMYDANISALEQEKELWRCFCYVEKLAKNSKTGSVIDYRFKKIRKIKTDAAKAQSIGATLLLFYGLKMAGIDPMTELVTESEHGKAILSDRSDVHFNLSHSKDHAVLALAGFEVGCDVQLMAKGHSHIARRFYAPEELEQIEKTDDGEDAFYRIWTAKESYIKWLGVGMAKDLRSFYVDLEQQQVYDKEKAVWTAAIFEAQSPSYRTAVCATIENKEKLSRMTVKNLLIEDLME